MQLLCCVPQRRFDSETRETHFIPTQSGGEVGPPGRFVALDPAMKLQSTHPVSTIITQSRAF